MKKEFNEQIDNKVLTEEILFGCLAKIEPYISKNAYLFKKYKNAGECFYGGYECEMKKYMDYRAVITNLLLGKYDKSTIKDMVGNVDKSDYCTNKLCVSVFELIKGEEYELRDS